MRPRILLFACLGLLLLGLAAASFRLRLTSLPVGEEATHLMMAQSLWRDQDLRFEQRDLARAYRVWSGGPSGLTLLTPDGGRTLRYAEPMAYALAAAPFYGLLGAAGLPILNMALWLGMAAAAAALFKDAPALLLAGFFWASAALGYVFRASPEVFLMACLFFALLLWRRGRERPAADWRLAAAGALLGAACLHQPALALLGGAVALDLGLQSRWRTAALLVLSGALVLGLLAAGQRRMAGAWNPAHPPVGVQRRAFAAELPLESSQDVWQAYGKAPAAGVDGSEAARWLPRNLGYFLVGRHAGLLPYFPFGLLVLALFVRGPRDRSAWLMAAALLLIVLLGLLLEPHRWQGGPGALGNARFAVLYPALLFLPRRLAARSSLLLPFAAAGLWASASVAGAVVAAPVFPSDLAALRALPLELSLLGGTGRLPGYEARNWGQGLWIVPRTAFWIEEGHPNGVWVRGASTSEVVVVSPQPLRRLHFSVHSLIAENEMVAESSVERVRVRFDSEPKRNGTPVDLAVAPAGTNLGLLPGAAREWVYRFTLSASDGIIPARRLAGSRDPRYLGVFLDFTGRGI